MKRNMKKLLGLLVLLTLAFTLSACAEQQKVPNEETYQEKSDRYCKELKCISARINSSL